MTQEELDALMAGGLDDLDATEDISPKKQEVLENKTETAKDKKTQKNINFNDYKIDSNVSWPPPPPTDDHKMVHQLDDVTRDSEKKATEMFDKLEIINNFFVEAEGGCSNFTKIVDENIALLDKLSKKFPNIKIFSEVLDKNTNLQTEIKSVVNNLQMGQDEIMMAMDMMQYQDIHRQKIERVINVMRALSKYMNTLFEGKIEDEKRVGSAMHIIGDTSTEDLVTNDDIEALIESLGKK